MKRIILHVGAYKAASSFLQEAVFPNLDGVNFVGSATPITSVMEQLNTAISNVERDPAYDCAGERASINRLLPDGRTVLSRESFFGHPACLFSDFASITAVLSRVFTDAKIILVIRRQDNLFESIYKHAVRNGTALSVTEFLNLDERYHRKVIKKAINNPTDYRCVDYASALTTYFDLFGRKNVLCIPYEKLLVDPVGFVGDIAHFSGGTSRGQPSGVYNRGLSALGFHCAFVINRMYAKNVAFPARVARKGIAIALKTIPTAFDKIYFSAAHPISPRERSRIVNYYDGQNRVLDNLVPYDLAQHGYYEHLTRKL